MEWCGSGEAQWVLGRRWFWIGVVALFLFWGCGEKSVGLDANELSNMLSLTNVSKQPIPDVLNTSQVAGVVIDVDVVQVGDFPILVPFLIRWQIRDAQGEVLGETTRRFEKDLAPGARVHTTLRVTFLARPNLGGLQDLVTFDPLPR
ncbi:MAG: hypothetical protein O2954_11065 [bacterium]|nr:hypothetical protein [bacterium]